MLTNDEILETINMINKENLDIRTITMGISLIDCMDSDIDKSLMIKIFIKKNMIKYIIRPQGLLRLVHTFKKLTVYLL